MDHHNHGNNRLPSGADRYHDRECGPPRYHGQPGATLEDAGWIVTGYAVANVIVLPMSGWLGDRFGRKNYFLTSIIVFTIASFLCGNAHTLSQLIAYRLLQGL